jgi:1,4-dihydroxy-2-naphthoate octaprenyltransferase
LGVVTPVPVNKILESEGTMIEVKDLLGPMRVPFLILAPVCVFLGIGTAQWVSGGLNLLHIVLVLVGAVTAHISVNALNEYFDYKSLLDTRTERTPFSGGSGTLPDKPEVALYALWTGIVSLVITVMIGVYFLTLRGFDLLPLGLLGVILIIFYTVWITRLPLLCLFAPGIGFGPVMVAGTNYALTGTYSLEAWVASLVPFFLVSNLLLLNQFPDVEADRDVGRRHYPIVIGRRKSARIYSAFLLLTYASIVLAVLYGLLPAWSLLGLLTVVLAWRAIQGAMRFADDTAALVPVLGVNVQITLLTPTLVAVGLLLGSI